MCICGGILEASVCAIITKFKMIAILFFVTISLSGQSLEQSLTVYRNGGMTLEEYQQEVLNYTESMDFRREVSGKDEMIEGVVDEFLDNKRGDVDLEQRADFIEFGRKLLDTAIGDIIGNVFVDLFNVGKCKDIKDMIYNVGAVTIEKWVNPYFIESGKEPVDLSK